MARYVGVIPLIVMMVATAVFAGACGTQRGGTQQVGEMQRESKSVEPKGARSARAKLKIGAGELNLTAAARTTSWRAISPTTWPIGSPG
jgi:UPF0716 family protein affecting phage T7 exclusion